MPVVITQAQGLLTFERVCKQSSTDPGLGEALIYSGNYVYFFDIHVFFSTNCQDNVGS